MRISVCNMNFLQSKEKSLGFFLYLIVIFHCLEWLFESAELAVKTLQLVEPVHSYWTAWVTAHCQRATWFLFPQGMEMKLFLRSVGCVIDTAYSMHTFPVFKCSIVSIYLLFPLFICFYHFIFNFKWMHLSLLTFTWVTAQWWYFWYFHIVSVGDTNNCTLLKLPDNRSNFVILFKVAPLPAVGNTQGGKGLKRFWQQPQCSACVRLYEHCVFHCRVHTQ